MTQPMYIVYKKNRKYEEGSCSYIGPTCLAAKLYPRHIYLDRAEAERDASVLSSYNSIGFEVLEYKVPTWKGMADYHMILFSDDEDMKKSTPEDEDLEDYDEKVDKEWFESRNKKYVPTNRDAVLVTQD